MVDTKTPGDKTLSVPTKTLTLKPRVETGTVRQSFSHGRTKQVVVEKRGKRRVGGDAPATETHAPEPVVAKAGRRRRQGAARPPCGNAWPRRAAGSGVVLRTLTEDERSARASALADAKVRESRNAGWPKKKPSAAPAAKASSRPNAKPPKPAARPRKNATGRKRKPSARPNSRPRSDLAKPRPRPRRRPRPPRTARPARRPARRRARPPQPCRPRARPASPPTVPMKMKVRARSAAAPAAPCAP